MNSRNRLKLLNTFSVNAYADQIIVVHDEYSLLKFWKKNNDNGKFVLILGGGSNVLFLEDYKGVVLLNRIKGIFVTENTIEWKLHVGAGERWNKVVMYTVYRNIPGLENLAYIPGYVGAAPIQNIGAYGVELSQVCEYVDVLDLNKGIKKRFDHEKCNFQYRGSIFKNYLYKYAILFVGIKLNKIWKPVLHYPALHCFNKCYITPREILNAIFFVRNNKLPDPSVSGNAGSFFKNPIINVDKARSLLKDYPNMPYYQQSNGRMKLLAGWLIEHCQLKGYIFGEASVYFKQASVLINNRQRATGTEIAALAFYIRNKVAKKFNIYLTPEVRLIGKKGEIDPEKLFKN